MASWHDMDPELLRQKATETIQRMKEARKAETDAMLEFEEECKVKRQQRKKTPKRKIPDGHEATESEMAMVPPPSDQGQGSKKKPRASVKNKANELVQLASVNNERNQLVPIASVKTEPNQLVPIASVKKEPHQLVPLASIKKESDQLVPVASVNLLDQPVVEVFDEETQKSPARGRHARGSRPMAYKKRHLV